MCLHTYQSDWDEPLPEEIDLGKNEGKKPNFIPDSGCF